MYYNYYDDPEQVDVFYLKTFPQFIGMSENDLKTFIRKVNRVETKQWLKESRAALLEKRNKDLAYIEEHGNTTHLPSGEVNIDRGINVRGLGDDNGFVTDKDLARQTYQTRLSLGKKKIYLPYIL